MKKDPEKLKDFNMAGFLDDEEMILELLNTVIHDGSIPCIASAIGDVARSQGVKKLSDKTGLTRQTFYRSLGPDGNPSFDTVKKVIEALGYKIEIAKAG